MAEFADWLTKDFTEEDFRDVRFEGLRLELAALEAKLPQWKVVEDDGFPIHHGDYFTFTVEGFSGITEWTPGAEYDWEGVTHYILESALLSLPKGPNAP